MAEEMKSTQIMEQFMNIVNRIGERGKVPREFGTQISLYQSEIHTIQAIKDHPEKNASNLADILGVTNGAVTQVIDKLVKKGLAEKYFMEGNRKSVYFRLTDTGETAYENHERYHESIRQEVISYLQNGGEEKKKIISDFLSLINEKLD